MTAQPYEQLSNAELQTIDKVCDEFESDLQGPTAPSIENYVSNVAELLKPRLFQELLVIELEFRRRRGDSISPADYQARFSDYRDEIEQAFAIALEPAAYEPTIVYSDDDTTSFPGDSVDRRAQNMPEQIGRYKIEGLLGRGGMGSVYLARDTQLDRRVAVKVPEFDQNSPQATAFVERFNREARAMATVEHPNICPIHDVGEFEGRPFLTMAYIEGQALSDRIRRERIPVDEAVKILRTLAEALQVAHDAGVVHRDLKPSNVMINANQQPIIMDFGLATRDQQGEADLTSSGTVIGSPAYMAPEQVRAEHDKTGPQTDVYALGVILYELLAGRRPYDGANMEVLGQIVSGTSPKPLSEYEGVDRKLSHICSRAMSPEIEDRYQSASDLGNAFGEWSDNVNPVAQTTTELRSRVKAIGWSTVGLLVLAIAAWTAGLFSPASNEREATDPSFVDDQIGPTDSDGETRPAMTSAQLSEQAVSQLNLKSAPLITPADEWVELLPLVDIDRDIVKGTFTKQGNVLSMEPGRMPCVQFPIHISGNYEIEVSGVRQSGGVGLSIFLPTATTQVVLWIEGSEDGKTSGIGCIDGKTADDNPSMSKSNYFTSDPTTTRVSVSSNQATTTIIASVNGHEIVNWRGATSSLSPDWAVLPSPATIGFGGWEIGYDFRSIRLRMTSGQSRFFPDEDLPAENDNVTKSHAAQQFDIPPKIVPDDDWVDVLPAVDLWRDTMTGSFTRTGDAIRTIENDYDSILALPVRIRGNYLLEVEGSRVHGRLGCTMVLPLFDRQVHLAINEGWDGQTHGLDNIGGKTIRDGNDSVKQGNVFLAGERKKISISVTSDADETSIRASVEGKTVVDWSGPTNTISLPKSTNARDPRELGIYDGAFAHFDFHRVRLKMLSGEATIGREREIHNDSPAIETNNPPTQPDPANAPFDQDAAKRIQQAWADYLKVQPIREVKLPGDVALSMVLIPPGKFLRGSDPEEQRRFTQEAKEESDQWTLQHIRAEGPQKHVTITRPFFLGKYEVTQQQWLAVMGQNPAQPADDSLPVGSITWEDVQRFLSKLNESVSDQDLQFVLPTEAQWEYACRAGSESPWHQGQDKSTLNDFAWTAANSDATIHAVGGLNPNNFGLYDMHGNVMEFCADWSKENYYSLSPDVDPPGPEQGTYRVRRGGSALQSPNFSRSARRSMVATDIRAKDLGFRLAAIIKTNESQNAALNLPTPAVAPFDSDSALKLQNAWSTHLGTETEFTNTVGMKFRLIPPGEFTKGLSDEQVKLMQSQANSPDIKTQTADEAPSHRVTLTQPFYIGVHEVTRGQFRQFVEATDHVTTAEEDGLGGTGFKDNQWQQSPEFNWRVAPGFPQTDQHPVVNISWHDAQEFCKWLSQHEGRKYTLPTEAQWEHTCRAGTTDLYALPNNETSIEAMAWFGQDLPGGTRPIGEKQPNAFGIHDMHGNVYEWCQDVFGPFSSGEFQNPLGPTKGEKHVLRGGSFNDQVNEVRSTRRIARTPNDRLYSFGFRVLLYLPESR